MNTVFVGGSRSVSRLPAHIEERLNNIIDNGHRVVIGDAHGADKAVQKHFLDAAYKAVTVFCSGDRPRNNLGDWHVHGVTMPKSVKGYQFYAAKDREMAREADFGLMIWDGKSVGTVLNVLRLVRAGKKAVLMNVPDQIGTSFKSATEWSEFLAACSPELREDLRHRALPEEWASAESSAQRDFIDTKDAPAPTMAEALSPTDEEVTATINAALASGNASSFVDALGNVARARGMTQIAKDTGLARESLYRSLGPGGNPEFATVVKIMAAVGFRFEACKVQGR